jgi:NAD(P)-dependent dehydrogenase (short-subunit alcohol dehydrogenase family)
MKGQSILITGAASGIGKGIAERLHRDGAKLILMDTDPDKLARVSRRLRGSLSFAGDVSDEPSVRDAIRLAEQKHHRLDGIVCNAGIMIRKTLEELTLTEWDRVLAVNLTQSFLFAKHGARLLGKAHGAMVLITSTRAFMSEPDTESYSASKGGLFALTHALSISLGPEVRVNAIAPGWIHVSDEKLRAKDHAQHPVGRVGEPADIAEAALFLLDPAKSGFMTGQTVVIDGGMTRKMIYEE